MANLYPATLGSVTGAAKTPSPQALEVLRGRTVILWPDADSAGREHMDRIAAALQGVASEVRIFEWEGAPAKGDAADHPGVLERRRSLLREIVMAPVWEPNENLKRSRRSGGSWTP